MGGYQVPGHGPGDDGYDEGGYDESQRAEILETTRNGPNDGTIVTDIDPDLGEDDDEDDQDALLMEDAEFGEEDDDRRESEEDMEEDEVQEEFDDGTADEDDLDDDEKDAIEP